MCILHFGNGLASHSGYMRERVGIYFDDNHNVLEAPTMWAMAVSKIRSRSDETTRNYANILRRFLQWLDDSPIEGAEVVFGAQNWQLVDEDVFDAFLVHIASPTDALPDGPSHKTMYHIAARVWSFYQWAEKQGYKHYLDISRTDIRYMLKDQKLLAHINPVVKVTTLGFNLPSGRPAMHQREMQKFVRQTDYEIALSVLNDPVYQIIAAIIRITGLRPIDLFQLPYRGRNENYGFIPYDEGEYPEGLDNGAIYYYFRSKGKWRSIDFPGKLWRVICEYYLPLRRQRAELYEAKHGIPPRNSDLFLSARGDVVTHGMLGYNFSKVVSAAKNSESATDFKAIRFNARMLRHTCATYFVYEALKAQNRLGRSFVYDAALDEDLRKMLGHTDVRTTLEYYVHLVNRYVHDNLLTDLHRSRVDAGLSAILDRHNYSEIVV